MTLSIPHNLPSESDGKFDWMKWSTLEVAITIIENGDCKYTHDKKKENAQAYTEDISARSILI